MLAQRLEGSVYQGASYCNQLAAHQTAGKSLCRIWPYLGLACLQAGEGVVPNSAFVKVYTLALSLASSTSNDDGDVSNLGTHEEGCLRMCGTQRKGGHTPSSAMFELGAATAAVACVCLRHVYNGGSATLHLSSACRCCAQAG